MKIINNKLFNIRKDDFKRFKECPKIMWIMRNNSDDNFKKWIFKNIDFLDKELLKKYNLNFKYDFKNKVKINSELEKRIIDGIEFEKFVKKTWFINNNCFDFEKIERKKISFEKTKKILNDNKYDVFYHPVFKYKNYITECDLLKRNKSGFDIYEIKAKSLKKITKKEREDLINDLLYQKWILTKLNINIINCYIIHINSDYLHNTEEIEFNNSEIIKINHDFNFSKFLDINIQEDLNNINKWFNYSIEEIKEKILNNSFCEEKETNYCTFLVPKIIFEHNILHLYRFRRIKKAEIFSKNNNNDNINLINNKYQFTNQKHIRQINVINNKEKIIENIDKVKKELNKYKYPIYFYDFETCPFSIPVFNKTKPYQQIPFQFSIHVLLNEEYDLKTRKNIKHYDFLTENKKNPILNFIDNFITKMFIHGPGTNVAYNLSFEKSIIKKIIENNSEELKEERINSLNTILDKSIDLILFFKNEELNFYLKEFKGSFSIKSVLPALKPDFSYKNLNIKNGEMALVIYFNYINNLITEKEWNGTISSDLKKYCGLDSLAMVIIFDKINEYINKK